MARRSSVALQFRAESYDHPDGTVDGGTVMTWIDKTAYAAAASWSGTNVVTSYVGNMHFAHPVPVETRVVVQARVVHTGATSIHVQTRVILPDLPGGPAGSAEAAGGVSAAGVSRGAAGGGGAAGATGADGAGTEPPSAEPVVCTECVMVYVSVDERHRAQPVRPWEPDTPAQMERERLAKIRSHMRREVEELIASAPRPEGSTAERIVLRFLAATKDVYPGETIQGGAVMRWIDEAADVCASRWCGESVVAVFAGGVRFYEPVHVGDLVELEARLVHTGPRSMHVSVQARAGDRRNPVPSLIAHGLAVMVATGEDGRAQEIRQWVPTTEADRVIERRAVELVGLRNRFAHEWAAG